MSIAIEFHESFLKQYEKTRNSYGDTEWAEIWIDTNMWSNLMIYNNDSVIRRIAPDLNLQSYNREPLRLDAVFTTSDPGHQKLWDWFPIVFAVEHENDPRGFHGEIHKLFSINCPLKVGITYALLDMKKDPIEIKKLIHNRINYAHSARNKLIREDPQTKYLFLVGVEERPRILSWSALTFRADQNPEQANFFNSILGQCWYV